MACLALTYSIFEGCDIGMSGIQVAYIAPKKLSNVKSFTYTPAISVDNTDGGMITAIAATGSAKFFTFQFNKDSSTWGEVETVDYSIGVANNVQTANFVFSKNEASKRNQVKILAASGALEVIILDNNGKYWLLGEEYGLRLSTATSVAGVKTNELNGWTLVLVGNERYPARELTGSALTAHISAV